MKNGLEGCQKNNMKLSLYDGYFDSEEIYLVSNL